MKAAFEKITYPISKAFKVSEFSTSSLRSKWHFHSEYEIVYIKKGSGRRFVGNSVEKFNKGDLVLLGSNLPHAWLTVNEKVGKTNLIEGIVIQFKKDFFPEVWFNFDEFKNIKTALGNSKRGLRITGKCKKALLLDLQKLVKSDGLEKVLYLLKILDTIGASHNLKTITNIEYYNNIKSSSKEKMEIIFAFILENYLSDINVSNAASLINMNETAFCRYFKKTANKTFIDVINEMRIGYACNLLYEKEFSISEICYKCGFNNLSNFNRQFKKITKTSPTLYRKSLFEN